jgi:hypothetical protein
MARNGAARSVKRPSHAANFRRVAANRRQFAPSQRADDMKSATLEALEPHGRQPAQRAREILRPDRHLRGIRDDALRDCRAGRRKIRNAGNGLSRVGRNHPVRTLTAPKSLAANLRQSGLRKFRCGKAVTAMWRRAVPRKAWLPWIGRGFATRRKGSARGRWWPTS